MGTRELPRDSWIEFLDNSSRRHLNRGANLEIRGAARLQTEAHELPLDGVSADHGGKRITITLGPRDVGVEHIIEKPSHVRIEEIGGADQALQIEAGGETTLLSFRAALPRK